MWNDTAFTRRFDLRYPIVQGPFGGGLSSPRLAATVSNAGGLGSYGAQGMTPDRIARGRRRDPRPDGRAVRGQPVGVDRGCARRGHRPRRLRRGGGGAGAVLRRAGDDAARRSRRRPIPCSRSRRRRSSRRGRRSSASSSACRRRRSSIAVDRSASAPSAPRRPSTRRGRSTPPASTRSSRPAPRPAAIGRRSSDRRRRR